MNFKTTAEIKAFQRKHGLVPDGILGPQTRKVIKALATPPAATARKEPDKAAIKATPTPDTLALGVRAAERRLTVAQLASIKAMVDAFPLATARKVSEIIVHCAATPEGRSFDRKDIDAWHKQRGWPTGIGYHAVVLLDGAIQVGRPIGQDGIHTAKHNKGTIGACYIGGLTADGKHAKDTRTPAQIVALYHLCQRMKAHFAVAKPIAGHNQYNANKACPSFSVPADPLGKL